jgi:hypothetical protein
LSDQTANYFDNNVLSESAVNMGGQATVTVVNAPVTSAPSGETDDGSLNVTVVNDVSGVLTQQSLDSSVTAELIQAILVEIKLLSFLINEGLNTKEDLDTLRKDLEE